MIYFWDTNPTGPLLGTVGVLEHLVQEPGRESKETTTPRGRSALQTRYGDCCYWPN